MTAQFVVLLTDENDPDRGEIKVLASAGDVARYVEVLLESGAAPERVRVFHGAEIALEISYRPVVSLSASREQPAAPSSESLPVADPGEAEAAPESEEPAETPGMRNGVRFSELFRPS